MGSGLKKLAVLHLNTDWGVSSKDIFVPAAKAKGGEITAVEGFLPGEHDFRSTLVRVRDTNPTGIIADRLLRGCAPSSRGRCGDMGLKQPIAAVSSVYSPKLLELGGPAVEGCTRRRNFFPGDPRPEVQTFVEDVPGEIRPRARQLQRGAPTTRWCCAHALVTEYGADRKAIHDGLSKISDVPSVVYGEDQRSIPRRGGCWAPIHAAAWCGAASSRLWDGSKPGEHVTGAAFGPWFDYTVNGLIVGNIYALLAVGLALIFGVAQPHQLRAWLGLYGRRLYRLGVHHLSAHAAAGDVVVAWSWGAGCSGW